MAKWSFAALSVLVLALGLGPAPARATEFMPLDQVRPGMIGVGRTVFEGTKIEEFKVEIIGTLENVGPRQSMVLARLIGGPLANTGVIAGMSGSPVFIDGKLLGAVAYGFPFSKETIAGITPIGEMIQATATTTPRAASARFRMPTGEDGPAMPLDPAALVAALRKPLEAAARPLRIPAPLAGGSPEATLTPVSIPLSFSGFSPETFDWAKQAFSGLGFTPVMGTGTASSKLGPLPDLEPGSPVGVTLVEGDLDVSATGTVTYVDGDRVYAFGHPFYNLGPTAFPMKKAYVYSVFPSLYQSWKISSPAEPVGTVEQDRITAIAGRVGPAPRMIPVHVRVRTSRGQEREYSFRVVDDELFTPVLSFMSLASILQNTERAFGTSSIGVDATVRFGGGRTVKVQDLFAEQQPAIQAASMVAAPLAYVLNNDFEKVEIEGLDVSITSHETSQSATLQRVWIERTGRVHAGDTVDLKLLLRTYRGDTHIESVPVKVPANLPGGTYSLMVADGPSLSAMEQRERRTLLNPKDLDQLMKAINDLRHRSHLYVRLVRADEGAVVSGEPMQSLPPSVMAVLGGSEQAGSLVALRTASVWDFDLPTDYAVSGSRTLSLTIER